MGILCNSNSIGQFRYSNSVTSSKYAKSTTVADQAQYTELRALQFSSKKKQLIYVVLPEEDEDEVTVVPSKRKAGLEVVTKVKGLLPTLKQKYACSLASHPHAKRLGNDQYYCFQSEQYPEKWLKLDERLFLLWAQAIVAEKATLEVLPTTPTFALSNFKELFDNPQATQAPAPNPQLPSSLLNYGDPLYYPQRQVIPPQQARLERVELTVDEFFKEASANELDPCWNNYKETIILVHGFDKNSLQFLTLDLLDRMDIKKIGHQQRIMAVVRKLL
jgi:hypothetical protein